MYLGQLTHLFLYQRDKLIWLCVVLFFVLHSVNAQDAYPNIIRTKEGGISFTEDALGNQIPDFSYAGYQACEKAIPTVENKIFVPQLDGDATSRIQAAIDYVGSLGPDAAGFRGAVLLDAGVFKINGTLYLKNSGIVLRGSGTSENGTTLLGTGIKREAVIRVQGINNKTYKDTLKLETGMTPLGALKIQVKGAEKLNVSDEITIYKPLTASWIKALNMESFGGESGWIGWKTRDWDIRWDRVIRSKNGNEVTLSAPITMTLDDAYGPTTVITYSWPGRIENIGVENLSMHSTFDGSNVKDEEHRWLGISMENVRNAWVRQVHFKHFAGGAVSLLKTAQQVTIEDCIATDPISEIAAFRRHTFYTEGQQTLFQRCYSEYGYHDFSVGGFGTTGPNAFVQCEARLPFANSGVIGSWATGVLFDITTIDGHALSFNNREQNGRGAGWTAANSVIWGSSASKIENYNPPTAQNWAFGVWGGIITGNGHWKDVNNHISPRSLFYAQLESRLGKLPVDPHLYNLGSEPSSSPTLAQAEQLNEEALRPGITMLDWIQKVSKINAISTPSKQVKSIENLKLKSVRKSRNSSPKKVSISNGWLVFDEEVITGKQSHVQWWRGSLRDHDVKTASPHVTRFVPGRMQEGLTDNLEEVVAYFDTENIIALEHNYGLWYERRMDDHQRVRRIDADVWPPFYEQPFARSGQGFAWDHLSKFDLTKYNSWYWYRLKHFADLAEPKGQLLINQQYFQHNILEAGAHWSSSPWRSANNINHTGFPEPPLYAGDKRIFMASQFYDTSNPVRQKIHQQFIRKSLENFQDNSNVIQLTSAEFTGPLHFMEFWLDEVQKWKEDTGKKQLIGLSATKDVQDAILDNKERINTVDIIDIRYWHYRADGSAYAPEGGKNLAPRQHARKTKPGKETEEQVYRAVNEYRTKHPEKAVLYSTNASSKMGWPVLMAGGSLAAIPNIEIDDFYRNLSQMKVDKNQDGNSSIWSLKNEGEAYLFYLSDAEAVDVDLKNYKGLYQVYWINSNTGEIILKTSIKGGKENNLVAPPKIKEILVVYIKKI